MRKNYVLDAGMLAFDPSCILAFKGNNVIIPFSEVKRLEQMKEDRKEMLRYQATEALSAIRGFMKIENSDCKRGIHITNGDIVLYILKPNDTNSHEKDTTSQILATYCMARSAILDENSNPLKTILVTRTLSLKVMAVNLGYDVEDYKAEQVLSDNMYSGIKEISCDKINYQALYSDDKPDIDCPEGFEFVPNEFVIITNADGDPIAKLRYDKSINKLKRIKTIRKKVYGISPLNTAQEFAVSALLDPEINMVSLLGGPGTGKTLLSLAAAFQQIIPKDNSIPKYQRVIFIRPMVEAGESMGFLPGDELEKLKPWMGSLYDSIETLLLSSVEGENDNVDVDCEEFVDEQLENKKLKLMSTTYMRGRTFHNTFVIVDEAQGITPHIMKMILTRIGKNSKIVLAGDPSDNQIDTELLDTFYNGLIYASINMKNSTHSALVQFDTCDTERSDFVAEVEKHMH